MAAVSVVVVTVEDVTAPVAPLPEHHRAARRFRHRDHRSRPIGRRQQRCLWRLTLRAIPWTSTPSIVPAQRQQRGTDRHRRERQYRYL